MNLCWLLGHEWDHYSEWSFPLIPQKCRVCGKLRGEDAHAVHAPGNLSVVLRDSRRGRAAVGHNVMARKGRRQGFECGQEVWVQGQRTWLHLKASYKNGWHVSPQVRLGGHLTDVVFEREMEVRE